MSGDWNRCLGIHEELLQVCNDSLFAAEGCRPQTRALKTFRTVETGDCLQVQGLQRCIVDLGLIFHAGGTRFPRSPRLHFRGEPTNKGKAKLRI